MIQQKLPKGFSWVGEEKEEVAPTTPTVPPLVAETPDEETINRMESTYEGAPSRTTPSIIRQPLKFAAGFAKKIPHAVVEIAKGIPEIGPTLMQMLSDIEEPQIRKPMDIVNLPSTIFEGAGKDVIAPMGKAVVGQTKEEWKKFKTDPEKYIYENPDQVIFALFDIASVGFGGYAVARKGYEAARNVSKGFNALRKVDKVADIVDVVEDTSRGVRTEQIVEESAKAMAKPLKTGVEFHAGESAEDVLELVSPGKSTSKATDYFRSPQRVFNRDPEHGVPFYNSFDNAQLEKMKWQDKQYARKQAAATGVKNGSIESSAVGYLLDEGLTVDDVLKMTPDQAIKKGIPAEEYIAIKRNPANINKGQEFLKDNFQYQIRAWGEKWTSKSDEAKLWAMKDKDITKKQYDALSINQKAVFDIYKNKIDDYLPHIFTEKQAGELLETEIRTLDKKIARTKPGSDAYNNLVKRRDSYVDSVNKKRMGGSLFDSMPNDVKFRFFNKRKGAEGYSRDAMGAYDTYLYGMGKKIFDEPALREAMEHYQRMAPELRPYAKWFARDYMGMNRHVGEKFFADVKSFFWLRSLGLNPRSAVVNLTQRINTIAEAPLDSISGARLASTNFGEKLFQRSGISNTLPQVLMAGDVASKPMEAVREVMGFMFSRVERGNQKHAFLTGYSRSRRLGQSHAEAMKAGRGLFEKTQFRYGKIGMPRALRGGKGVLTQFWSYPIKQMEFLSDLAKENPAKLLGWIAMTEGGKGVINEIAGIDMSSSMGLGIDAESLIKGLASIPKGEFAKARYNITRSVKGGGFFPQGFGPAVESISNLIGMTFGESEGFNDFISEIEPGQLKRTRQGVDALVRGKDESGLYTVNKPYKDEPMYRETLRDLVARTFVASPTVETKQWKEASADYALNKIEASIKRKAADMMVRGDVDGAYDLLMKYDIPEMSQQSLMGAMERKYLTPGERRQYHENVKSTWFREKMNK